MVNEVEEIFFLVWAFLITNRGNQTRYVRRCVTVDRSDLVCIDHVTCTVLQNSNFANDSRCVTLAYTRT